MKVTNDKTENRQAFLTIEMEPDEIKGSLEASYKRLAKKVDIPGFRKGKAPQPVMEQYLGKDSILEDAINHLVPDAYEKALKEQDISAIAPPHIEVVQTDPVIFKATVPMFPTIELGDYSKISITPDPAPVNDSEVDTVLEELRHQNATWEPVERAVDFGDLAILKIESNIDNEPFINHEGAQYRLAKESPSPVPGFAEQLAGLKQGEKKEFTLELPADYPKSELAGKTASFRVNITEIKQEILPELNDELAKQISTEFQTIDALREQIATDFKLRVEERARIDFEERLVQAVVDVATVEFPPILVEEEVEHLLHDQSRRLQMSGAGLEDYLKSVNKTEEQLHEELHPVATRRVTSSLVLGKVAEDEKIEIADSEIDNEIENMVKGTEEKNREGMVNFLGTPQSRESIKQTLLTRKTIEHLAEIAGNTDTPKKKGKEKNNE